MGAYNGNISTQTCCLQYSIYLFSFTHTTTWLVTNPEQAINVLPNSNITTVNNNFRKKMHTNCENTISNG